MATEIITVGKRSGPNHLQYVFPIGASEVFKQAGGGFMKTDGSGRVEFAGDGDKEIIGHHLLQIDFTASSTEGGTNVAVDMSQESVYETPIDTGTWADTMRAKTCDLGITSNVQGVNLSTSTDDCILLLDKGTTNPAGTVVSVLCKINPANVVYRGVA